MASLVQSQVLSLPKIKTTLSSTTNAKNIQHLIRDEDITPPEVSFSC